MIQALAIPLPLADGDDVAKIVIGVVFALIWIIAQAVSSIGAKKRAGMARRPRLPPALPAPARPPAHPAQSYDELRRQRQQQAQRRSQPVAPPARARKPQPPAPRAVPAPAAAPILQELVGVVGVRAGEIGGENSVVSRRQSTGGSAAARRVRAMLQPHTARDVIIAGELLSPPVSLRQEQGPI